MKYSSSLLITMIIAPLFAWAHGEDKPGPHGGAVKMPGAFHTELILNKDQSAQVYLIDINFKNPTTKDSSVKIFARNKNAKVDFTCSAMSDHFHCIPAKKYPSKGELVVQATREKAVGNEAVYKLPLEAAKTETKPEPEPASAHSHH